jgi:hypothetical protein
MTAELMMRASLCRHFPAEQDIGADVQDCHYCYTRE